MVDVTFEDYLFYPVGNTAAQQTLKVGSVSNATKALGGIRHYSGGTRRSVTLVGDVPTLRVNLSYPTREQVLLLTGWVGRVCVFRDPSGAVVWALLKNVATDNKYTTPDTHLTKATLTLEVTTDTAEE